jgi:lysylphosphatidylglycerol synthetase-like protein (DUF2156 family)
MKGEIIRASIAGGVVCLASWLALAGAAGSVGLQRSISKGAASFFEIPIAVIVVSLVAAAGAYAVTRMLRTSPTHLLAAFLVGHLVAGLVLAPLAVGELELIHAPLVFAAVSVLGIQPAAALLGAWLASGRRRVKKAGDFE